MEKRPAEHWEQRYRTGDLPWDSGEVEPQLRQVLDQLHISGQRALEIGCGTGTNAIELARRGFEILALDVSQSAIDMATRKAEAAGVKGVMFQCHDIIESLPVEPASTHLVFDRGCFHAVADEDRLVFSQRVADALRPGGYWLCLCGNADETTEGGPPRLSAAQIAEVVEPHFEIHRLIRKHFKRPCDPAYQSHLSWQVLLRRR